MTAAVIVDAVRTPMGRGKPGGSLSAVHPVDLLAQVLSALVARNDLDPAAIDDVVIGCVSQVGEQSGNVGRMALLAAGWPESVPSVTVERKCGSSQQAIEFAAYAVMAGAYDLVVAGGVESMSRVRMGVARNGADPYGAGVAERFAPGLVSQGISAELVAARWNLDREAVDRYAASSHRRAAAASEAFAREIIPVAVPGAPGVLADETIRPDSSIEGLAKLKPAFYDEQIAARFPEIGWTTTAGNSSQITDGASAVLIASEQMAQTLRLTPRARFRSFAVCGDDPLLMLTGPVAATERVLKKAGLTVAEIDHVEVNEAFACVPLAWLASLHADPARLNPRGGAIALGHPLGASGARLMTTMLHALEDTGARLGLQTMCEAGGMANAMIIERL
jgi:acetyl-CoA acyltransferase